MEFPRTSLDSEDSKLKDAAWDMLHVCQEEQENATLEALNEHQSQEETSNQASGLTVRKHASQVMMDQILILSLSLEYNAWNVKQHKGI